MSATTKNWRMPWASLFLLSGLASSPAVAQQPPADMLLFVLAGQSNMSGRGLLNQLPTDFPAHGDQIWMFDNADRWRPAREPIDDASGQVDQVSADDTAGVGPGLAFAEAVAAELPGRSIGLIPCARGGTAISLWQPSEDRNTLFGSCMRRTREAIKRGRVAAILWHQGESDTYSEQAATEWPIHLGEIVKAWRAAYSVPVIAATVGTISDKRRENPLFMAWDVLLRAQSANKNPDIVMLDGSTFEVSSDGLHFSTIGQLQMGRAMAAAYLKMR